MIQRNTLPIAMVCVFVTLAIGLFLRPLTPIDETRYMAVAWEMYQSGDWFVPTKNFAAYSDKPPFLFWAINLMWLITGVSEFSARLVGPIMACVALWLTSVLGRRLWPDERAIGNGAALALAGLVVFVTSGSLTMFDVPLTVATLLGLIALTAARDDDIGGRRLWPWAGFGAAIALGVLIKGPVILFHLLPAAILLPLWSRDFVSWKKLPLRIGFGLLVGLALLSLWLVPAVITGGQEYRDAILWQQSAGRLADSFAHARPWWFYLSILPLLTFPLLWSPTLWKAGAQTSWRADGGLMLCVIWPVGALILFSLASGKQVHYLLPELPALALIAARLGFNRQNFSLLPAIIVMGLLALLAILAGAGLISLGRAQTLFQPRSMLLVWALLIISICWLAFRWRGLAAAAVLSLGTILVSNLQIGLTDASEMYSADPIAAILAPKQADGLAFVGDRYHAEFNFAARLTSPVAELDQDLAAIKAWVAQHPQGMLVGRVDLIEMPWAPMQTILFRNREYGIWSAANAPKTDAGES
ncbi:ArnT family glycosyltransferase [Paracoccus pacificus]|uniref:ArnT family glycosyltransferase n=1 Tax=Paracoccus pacificus TaxID=1463598 RepID=A0ABW4R883_9RHOB